MWIELSEFNFKLFIPLIFPVFKRVQDVIKKLYMKKDNQLFKTFRYFTSYMLSFIFLIIIYYRTRKIRSENIENKENVDTEKRVTIATAENNSFSMTNTITELKKKNAQKTKIYSIIFLAGLCAMGLFCYFFRHFFEDESYRDAKQSIGIFFDIAGYIGLSYLLLKQKLYLHSYVSSGIMAFILVILFIISTFYIDGEVIWKSFIYYFFYSLSFVLYDILKKIYMKKFFNSPYFMMLVIGSVNVLFVLIFDLIAHAVDNENKGVINGIKINIKDVGDCFLMILDIILQFFWNLGIWLTIYYLTPCHYFISEYISEYIYYLQSALESDKEFYSTVNIVLFSIAYLINFLCCLIFNEVFILNFCGLDYNTNKRINERTRLEVKDAENDKNMLEMDNDTGDKEDQSSN